MLAPLGWRLKEEEVRKGIDYIRSALKLGI